MVSGAATCWGLIPAAGSGRRLGAALPKQFLEIGGRSVLAHSLDALLAERRIHAVVVVLGPGVEVDLGEFGDRVLITRGGDERADSVARGLNALADRAGPRDWVLVHDAARPCLQQQELSRLIEGLDDDAPGGLLAVPMRDTVKRACGADQGLRHVVETLDRSRLWLAQTPQMFRYAALCHALDQAARHGLPVTDEASAMEAAGCVPRLIPGAHTNFKITYPEDLMLAEAVLRGQGRI